MSEDIFKGDNIFKIKILALLHDPPWKPWSITGSIRDKNGKKSGRALEEIACEFGVEYYERSNKYIPVHEKEGFTFAMLLGIRKDEIEEYYDDIVKEADRFSAGVERFTVDEITGEKKSDKEKQKQNQKGGGPIKQERKHNVFNVNHKYSLSRK